MTGTISLSFTACALRSCPIHGSVKPATSSPARMHPSYWSSSGLPVAMGSLAGGEQSAMHPFSRLQLAKSPVPPSVPPPVDESEPEPESEVDSESDSEPESEPEGRESEPESKDEWEPESPPFPSPGSPLLPSLHPPRAQRTSTVATTARWIMSSLRRPKRPRRNRTSPFVTFLRDGSPRKPGDRRAARPDTETRSRHAKHH